MAKNRKWRRVRIHEVTQENDIKYLGPLNYQHFQILGWLCIVISQIVVLLTLGGRMDADFAEKTEKLKDVLFDIASLSLPLLLIANFARILNASEGYLKQLITNGLAMLGIALLSILVYSRYGVGTVEEMITKPEQAYPFVEAIIHSFFPQGFVSFNIFVDLFLCSLVMFFLNYRPTKVFTGKSVIIFRLFTLLPIAYEVVSMVLKVQASWNMVTLPFWSFPFLTVKPPMTFLLFIFLAIFVKTREIRFRRHGKTHEDYQAFLKTRRNSWGFSLFLAVMLVVLGILDYVVLYGYSLVSAASRAVDQVTQVADTVSAVAGQETVDYIAKQAEALLTEEETASPAASASPQATGQQAESTASPQAAASQANPEASPQTAAEQANPSPSPQAAANQADPAASPQATSGNTAAPGAEEENYDEITEIIISRVEAEVPTALALGFGGSVYMVFLAPLVLLFSYTRKPKHEEFGLLIPVAGILLIIIVYIEGLRAGIIMLPKKKLDLTQMTEFIKMMTESSE